MVDLVDYRDWHISALGEFEAMGEAARGEINGELSEGAKDRVKTRTEAIKVIWLTIISEFDRALAEEKADEGPPDL